MSEPAAVVTFTANPSIDRTFALAGALARGEVNRASGITEQAAGKGVNVARVLNTAGIPASAVAAFLDEAFLSLGERLLPSLPIAGQRLPIGLRVRVNTTVTEPDGTTTKLNEPGPTLSASQLSAAADTLLERARGANWVALSGSLPPGAPSDWYKTLAIMAKATGSKVAIDTSGAALDAVIAGLPEASFDLIKPNSEELAQLTGGDAGSFENSAASGDLSQIIEAARDLQGRGIAAVLVTLGGSGAVLVTAGGAWYAQAPRIVVKSTVGAGDSAVAGFILAQVQGADPADCLAASVAYGSAAASLPGTTLPKPSDLVQEPIRVVRID